MNDYMNKKNNGMIITYVLVFGLVFLIIFGSLCTFVIGQLKISKEKVAWNEALHIAEAGVNYYKWCLNNNVESLCQTEKDYIDNAGNIFGGFSLNVTSSVSCGQTIQKKVVSTGWTNDFPNTKRKVSILYARESVAKYSYILNSDVWIGDDHQIRGPYSSNGGIRMDGENQSLMISAKDEWICTSSFGCSSCPTSHGCHTHSGTCYCPGVFTTTDNSSYDLFRFPEPPFDFTGITVDLSQMKASAQASGVYLPPSKTLTSQGKGYHLKFRSDGKVEAWVVTQTSSTYAYSLEEDWHYDNFTISSEYMPSSLPNGISNPFSVPQNCSAIYVEDNIWPEGTVEGKVAIASANLIDSNIDTDAILNNNVNYASLDGSDGFAIIAERNILIGPSSPNQMTLRGIFVAQKGRFARNHYPSNIKSSLHIYGSIISNGRVGTQWTSGSSTVSGYLERESYFDSNLIYDPPPFVPYINPDFKVVKWEEAR
jgi:hypothetical protein